MKLTTILESYKSDADYVYNNFYIFDDHLGPTGESVVVEENSTEKYLVDIKNGKVTGVSTHNEFASEARATEILKDIRNKTDHS